MANFFRFRQRRVLVDIDTQYDLLYNGRKDQRQTIGNIRRIFAWARVKGIPVISTALTVRADRSPDEITEYPPICIEKTPGAAKIPYTLRARRVEFEAENRLDLPLDLFETYDQVIFDRWIPDPFELPRADRMLSEYKFDEYLIIGTGLDRAILKTVLGLRQREKRVIVIGDAIDTSHAQDAALTLRKIESKGGRLVTTQSLAGKSRLCGTQARTIEYPAQLAAARA